MATMARMTLGCLRRGQIASWDPTLHSGWFATQDETKRDAITKATKALADPLGNSPRQESFACSGRNAEQLMPLMATMRFLSAPAAWQILR